jgi:hypothetical protein
MSLPVKKVVPQNQNGNKCIQNIEQKNWLNRLSCMQSKVTFAVLDGVPWSCPPWFVEMNE